MIQVLLLDGYNRDMLESETNARIQTLVNSCCDIVDTEFHCHTFIDTSGDYPTPVQTYAMMIVYKTPV
jgi:hypothetical protein